MSDPDPTTALTVPAASPAPAMAKSPSRFTIPRGRGTRGSTAPLAVQSRPAGHRGSPITWATTLRTRPGPRGHVIDRVVDLLKRVLATVHLHFAQRNQPDQLLQL